MPLPLGWYTASVSQYTTTLSDSLGRKGKEEPGFEGTQGIMEAKCNYPSWNLTSTLAKRPTGPLVPKSDQDLSCAFHPKDTRPDPDLIYTMYIFNLHPSSQYWIYTCDQVIKGCINNAHADGVELKLHWPL